MLHAAAQSVDFSNQLIDVSKLFTQNKMCWDWNKRAYARGTKSLLVDLKKPKILRDTSKTHEFSGVFTSIPLILLLSHISRWERSIFWQLSAENATFRWWFSLWCPATCCAGCPMASWHWWPPLVGRGWWLPSLVWFLPSWPSSALLSTLLSMFSSTNRWEWGHNW